MGDVWWQSSIVSVVFGQGSIVVVNIRRIDIVRLGEYLYGLVDLLEINFGDLVHLL